MKDRRSEKESKRERGGAQGRWPVCWRVSSVPTPPPPRSHSPSPFSVSQQYSHSQAWAGPSQVQVKMATCDSPSSESPPGAEYPAGSSSARGRIYNLPELQEFGHTLNHAHNIRHYACPLQSTETECKMFLNIRRSRFNDPPVHISSKIIMPVSSQLHKV